MTKQAIGNESLPTVENGNDTNEKQSIWVSILRDVKSSTKKAPAAKSLVVLGDNESGRTTLVARLQGNDDPKRGAGLEYHYIDVKDDDRDDTPKLGVWILDGDVACSAPLLKFAIKSETLENTILILVASMTHPWSLLSTLRKWTTLIEEHIDKLQIDPIRLRDMRDRLQYEFQHYMEPNDTSIMLISSTSSTTLKSGTAGTRVPNSISSVSLASTQTLSPITSGDEQVVLPLADGVLTKSLGIPVIVVITKCDVMPTLEKENDYKDEYFDFMQHHLRKFCLEYGAALFYTSVKEKKNIDKLYKYIVYKCYGYPFTSTAAIVERDAIFIPAGWDNPKKADILLENLHRLKSTDNYSDVFIKPVVRRPLQRDNDIVAAEDDQEFLSKLQLTLNRAASPGRTDENTTPVLTRTSGVSSGVGSQTPSVAGRSRNQPSTTPGGTTAAANEGALANFFNSLLTRKSGGAVTPTGSNTPTTQRQTSQSPTTPSSKRLQQHPLTFAVTPPPGRTRTPTSHKPFSSALNVESPPRLLSPVAEQQNKVEITSASTPLKESEAIETMDNTKDMQSSVANIESIHSDQNENQSIINADQQNMELINSQYHSGSNITQKSDENILNSSSASSVIAEKESDAVQTASNDENNRRLSNDLSPSHQNTTQNLLSQSLVTEIPENNEQTINTSIPVSLSQPNEHSLADNMPSTSQSRSSSPVRNEDTKVLDQSPLVDQKSPRLLSGSNFENIQEINNTENQSYNNEEQQIDLKQSVNASHRNSITNSSDPLQTLSTASNELEQQENQSLHSKQFDRQSSLSDVQKIPSPVQSAPMSPITLEASELPFTDQKQNSLLSTQSEQIADTNVSNEGLDENSLSSQPPMFLSTSNVNTDEHEQHDQNLMLPSSTYDNSTRLDSPLEKSDENSVHPSTKDIDTSSINENHNSSVSEHRSSSPTTDQQNDLPLIENDEPKSPACEAVLSPIFIPENLELIDVSLTNETGDVKFDSHETSTALPTAEEKYQRSRSSSPTNIEKREENRSASPITQPKLQKSRSPSPVAKQYQQRSRSPSPIIEQERSRPPSPLIQDEQQRSRSSSPTLKHEQQRSESASPTTEQQQESNRSASPVTGQHQERSRSPSPLIQDEKEKSRSLSLLMQDEQQRSRSSSPTLKHKQQRSESISPTTEQQELNRSASPITEQHQERIRTPSPTGIEDQQKSHSPSPTVQHAQQRSRSPSPIIQDEQQRSRSPSPIPKHRQQRSGSVSPTTEQQQQQQQQQQESNRSASPVTEQHQERIRTPSSTGIENRQRSRSPSPIIQQKQQRSRSPSPSIIKQDQQRSRSPSPPIQDEQQRNRSPSPTFKREQQRSGSISPTTEQQELNRSASPITEQHQERGRSSLSIGIEDQQRSRSPSPNLKLQQQRSRSPSPNTQQQQELNRSAPPVTEQHQKRSRPPSPIGIEDQRRSRSPSPIIQHEQQRSRSPSPVIQDEQQKSHSSSPAFKYEQQRSRSPSPNTKQQQESNRSASPVPEQHQERIRTPSPTGIENRQRSRSPSPTIQQDQQRSRSPSPPIQDEQQRSRSPSPTFKHGQERSGSISPITEQQQQESNRSTSPVTEQHQERNRTPSPIGIEDQQRSRSPSPTIHRDQQKSRSPSPIIQHEQQRSRSPSPSIIKQDQQRSRSVSIMEEQTKERSRSISPADGPKQQRSRSSSVLIEENSKRSRSPSPSIEMNRQKSLSSSLVFRDNQEQSRSPLPTTVHTEQRSRSPSPNMTHKPQRSLSPSMNFEQNEEQSHLSSPITVHEEQRSPILMASTLEEQKEQRSRSSSLTSQQDQPSNRSASPANQQKHERSRTSSVNVEQEKQRSRTPSPNNEEKQMRSRSPSPNIDQNQQKDLVPIESLENDLDSTKHESILSKTFDDHEIDTQLTNKATSSPTTDNQQDRELDTLASPIKENQRTYSSSQIDNNLLHSPVALSPKSEQNKTPQSPTSFHNETIHNFHENTIPAETIEPTQQARSRSPSSTHIPNNETKSLTPSSPKNDQIQKPPLSSPLTEEPFRISSPLDQQEISLIKTKHENHISPLASPLLSPSTENPSTQTLKSVVNRSISSTSLDKQDQVSSIPTANQEQSNILNSSTQRSSVDHPHESNSSSILKPSIDRRLSFTRSQSQSTLTRPNTLHFTPNEHNLDGLYMSNDYNDEDEILEDNEYHHNSAPSTVSVEFRRSSLLHDTHSVQRHTPIDPNDILKRLSIVEKSRIEDNENNTVDSTNLKDS